MLSVLGFVMVSGAILTQGYYAYESIFLKNKYYNRKIIEKLFKAFEKAGLYKKEGKQLIYPYLFDAKVRKNQITFIFSIPKGMNPDEFEKKQYIFNQYFGKHIDLKVEMSRVIFKVYSKGLPTKFNYNFDEIKTDHKLPIVVGKDIQSILYSFDLVEHPHCLIAGETGSGKSSAIRSILTTLIKMKSATELNLILGDLKRSEFHLFKNIDHVEGVYHSADELKPVLIKIKKEMIERGDKLDKAEVNSIDELEEKLPYIVICIDEVVLLKDEKDIMNILEQISSIGRSLGIFLILSLQRPDFKIMEGALKANLTVRFGFKTQDAINSKIIGTAGSEKISNAGRMILNINSNLQEMQGAWLSNDKAKALLMPYKVKHQKVVNEEIQNTNEYEKLKGLFQDES